MPETKTTKTTKRTKKKLSVPDASKTVGQKEETKEQPKEQSSFHPVIIPSIGKIKLGIKNERGLPQRLNYIRITTEVENAPWSFSLVHYLTALLNTYKPIYPDEKNLRSKVTRIYGLLPYNDPYKNLYVYRGKYVKSGPVCTSDPIKNIYVDASQNPIRGWARRTDRNTGEILKEEVVCSPECPMRKDCKWHGIFKMYPVIPKFDPETGLTFPTAYIGQTLILRTTSWSIIRDLIGGMMTLKTALGGLTGYVVQLDLTKKRLGEHIVNSLVISAALPLTRFSYQSLKFDVSSLVQVAEDVDEMLDEVPEENI